VLLVLRAYREALALQGEPILDDSLRVDPGQGGFYDSIEVTVAG
jgi:hypothetical protein